jgi:pSer/pThr/pTyr-binding forkhead associated (FHA) protein
MDAKLVVIGGKANMGEVKLRLPMTIGRGSKADLIISHPTVSREHCKLTEIKGELLVTDNGSSNGVFVDGEKIEKPTIVRSGQILAIGPLTFRAEYEVKAKKPKAPTPDKSGLAETQAVDRDEFDIDFIMDDSPSAQTQAAVPKKKSDAAKTIDTTKKASKPEAKAPAAPKQPAPAKDAPKDKSSAAPRVGETDELDLDFLLDDVAAEKKKSPAGRDTDQIDVDALDLIAGDEKPKAPSGDDLTTDFRDVAAEHAAAEKTVEFEADEFDLGDDFFAEEKTEEPAAPTQAAAPAAPEAKSPKVEKPAAKEPAAKEPAKKNEEPVAKAPIAAPEKPAVEAPKKSGAMDFDFLSAGPAAPKEEVSLGDFATQFDFSAKSKKPEVPAAPEVAAEGPVAEWAAAETPADEIVAESAPAAEATPAAREDEAMFDDFLAELGSDAPAAEATASTPVAEEEPVAEVPVVEEPKVEEPVAEISAADEFALDELLLDEAPAVAAATPTEAASAPVIEEDDELPFSEPIAPPAASELPSMPELAAPEPAETKAPVFDDEMFGLDEPTVTDELAVADEPAFHEAADAAAVVPAEKAETFAFEGPPTEVPMFDAASEKMTLEEAIAAETPTTSEVEAAAEPTEEPIVAASPAAETKADDALDFDFLSDLDPPAVEAAPTIKAEEPWPNAADQPAAEKASDDLVDISLDLDEVPAAPPAPQFDLSAMNETQDIDLRAQADENPFAAPMIEMNLPSEVEVSAKGEAREFDFLEPEAPQAEEKATFDFSALESKQPSANDQTIAFTAPAAEAPAAEAPAEEAAAADDFDFLAEETPAPQAAAPEVAPAADSGPGEFEINVAAKGEGKTEAFDFGMFGEAETKPAPAEEIPEFGISAESEFAVGPSVQPSASPKMEAASDELPGAMNLEAASAIPMTSVAKAKPPAAPKLSLLDKIKMLFGGGKAKPSKAKPTAKTKTTQGISDAPVAKLPPLAPQKPSLDPIPLDDGPAPTFDFDAPAAEQQAAEAPAFDFGPSISLDSTPVEPDAAAPSSSGVPKGWTPTDAPIPLDDDPISLFDEPVQPTDAPAPPAMESPAAEAASTVEEKAPWDDIEASPTIDVSESNAPFTLGDVEAARPAVEASADSAIDATDEFDFLADDSVMDASANPEAQALALQAAQEAAAATPVPAAETPVAETPAAEAPVAETPVAEELKLEEPAAPAPETAAAEAPAVDDWMASLDAAPAAEATRPPEAVKESELEALGLVDDVALADSAPTASDEPAASEAPAVEASSDVDSWLDDFTPASDTSAAPAVEAPAAEADDFQLSSEPAAANDATVAWAATNESIPTSEIAPSIESPAAETPAAEAADAWSFEEFANEPEAEASDVAPATEAPTAELGFADVAGSPAAEAPAPLPPPAPPVSSRRRPVDVDLRISSSLLSLTRLSVRPPRIDFAEMEPDVPSGRSFEPRAKNKPQAPAAAPTNEPVSEPAGETPAAPEAAGGFSFDDWSTPTPPAEMSGDAPWESAASASTEPAAAADRSPAASEGAAAEAAEEFSFLDDFTTAEAPTAAAAADVPPTAANIEPAATDDSDRTTAYLGSPKVVEEAESFLASLDESAAAAPEPAFDLDAMLADADKSKPAETAPTAEAIDAASPIEEELSFLTLSDEVVESEPVAEVPAPVKPEEAAHAPSADADFGFLDLMEEKEARADDLPDFGFDAPQADAKDAPQAEAVKIEPAKPETGKNGAKPTPQPAAASPTADAELDDFLRDLGMN